MKNRFDELRRGSWNMPDGRQKLAVLEEMIQIADRYMTEEDGFDTRITYMFAAQEAGCSEKMLVAFSWCLSKFEKSPGAYPHHTIMWHYKWILNNIWQFPEFSLEQIERIFEDFKEKCLNYGYSLRPYYQQQVNFMLSQGLLTEAAQFYKMWRSTPRDSLADCKACEQNFFGVYQFKSNHLKRGMQTVKPILDGKMQCGSIPQNTYSQVIVPLLKLKEYEIALATAKKAIQSLKGPQYIVEYGIFLEFFTVTNLNKAEKIYNQTIRFSLESKVGWERFQYFLSVRQFLRVWNQKKRRKKLAESDRVSLEWLDLEIASLADAFNQRNGNTYMDQLITDKDNHTRRLVEAYRNL